ncbi:MAG: hypothetical protein AAF236_03260 [Verrucomicrobiota bacterium]
MNPLKHQLHFLCSRGLPIVAICLASTQFSAAQEQPHPGVIAAEAFFEALVSGELDAAYQAASDQFRRNQSFDVFEEQVAEVEATDLSALTITKGTASADGKDLQITASARNGDGKKRIANIRLIEEGGTFKMLTFTVKPAIPSLPPPVNDPDKTIELTRETLTYLATALETGDFTEVHERIPLEDRQQNSIDSIEAMARQINASSYGPIADLIDRLEVRSKGEMKDGSASYFLAVNLPERKRQFQLDFRSLWSDPKSEPWLVGWRFIYANPDSPETAPTKNASLTLAQQTLEVLFAGFTAGSLSNYYESTTPFFREVFPLERVEQAYPAFTGGEVDYQNWQLDSLELLSKEVVGSIGPNLVLKISIPTGNSAAFATLTYLHEGESWENVGINFHSKNPVE